MKENGTSGACGTDGREEEYNEGFSGNPEGNKPLGRSTHRWGDDIKMNLTWNGRSQTGFLRLRKNKWQAFANIGKGPISFSRTTVVHIVNFHC
jgi:hypothetical protein